MRRQGKDMKSKVIHRLMRLLITAAGAGAGAALTLAGIQMLKMAQPDTELPLLWLVAAYLLVGGLGALVAFLFSNLLLNRLSALGSSAVRRLDSMPAGQLLTAVVGLILGLMIAALLSQAIRFMGESMFTTAFSAIVFVGLGVLGYNIGYRRSADFWRTVRPNGRFRLSQPKRMLRREKAGTAEKLIDASALVDGRVEQLHASGFLEGTLVVPCFVVDGLRQLADSSDSQRHARGERGLAVLEHIKAKPGSLRVDDTDYSDVDDADVKMLKLARHMACPVITCDYNLSRAAAVSDVKTLNIHLLASALRPSVQAGDILQVSLVREGREPGQGVAYLPDGTMVVVENARERVGETVSVTVTTALQTSAGRMVFARLAD